MEISDFSSLIEVGVTLNIACVAIEYVKSYTSVLCNQVFGLGSRINDAVNECRKKLDEIMDKTTLENLPETFAKGRSLLSLKRDLTKSREELSNKINSKTKELTNIVFKVCELKNISSNCLWLFLYGLTALFLMGIEEEYSLNTRIHQFWFVLSIIGIINVGCSWVIKKAVNTKHNYIFCSLRFSLITFFISLIISLLLLIPNLPYVNNFLESYWNIVLITSMILMYSNFAISSLAIWNRAKKSRKLIDDEKHNLLKECMDWNQQAVDIQGALNTDKQLEALEKNEK